MLNEDIRKSILELQKLYPVKRSALIPALHLAQAQEGYLPAAIQADVAELFEITENEVHAIVSFYDMFYEKPMGKHIIHACKNVSCMLRGADDMISKMCHKLQVRPGETSADGEFTVIPSECLGACDRAPMCIIDDKVVGPIKDEEIDQILAEAKSRDSHS